MYIAYIYMYYNRNSTALECWLSTGFNII